MPPIRSAHLADSCGLPVFERDCGRVLLIDDLDRVLLFEGLDPGDPAAGTWWFTIGGGVEGDETPYACALRELAEETGIEVDELDGPVLLREAAFDFEGMHILSHESYYVARVAKGDIAPRLVTEIERRSVLGHRWWPIDELVATTSAVHPDGVTIAQAAGLLADEVAS
jgi:8-oxo-dGTP pyrophosphatase MutT (NUDIX family)